MIQVTVLLKPELSKKKKKAIKFLWSYNDIRENLKRKHKFFIDSPVQIYEYGTWDSN